MKTCFLLFWAVLVIPFVRAESFAEHISVLVASADGFVIRREMSPKEREAVIREGKWMRDANWIRHVSDVIARTPLAEMNHCMCEGWTTAYFYRKNEMIVSIAAIHGNQVRIYTEKGGGDIPVDEAAWKAVKLALEPPKEVKQTEEAEADHHRQRSIDSVMPRTAA